MRPATQAEYAAVVRSLPHESCQFYHTDFPRAAYALWMDENGQCVAKATYLPAMDGVPALKIYEVAA